MQLTGYRRADGRVGFRNHVLVLPTVICSNGAASKISSRVPSTVTVSNNSGCCLLGRDRELYLRTLVNTGTNPNVAAVLVVGLGCEPFSAEQVAGEIAKSGKPVAHISIQGSGGMGNTIAEGVKIAGDMVAKAAGMQREPVVLGDLIIGLECGGSDAASGLSANAAVGMAADMLVDQGGSVILGETDEWIGAEKLIARNAASPEVGADILRVVDRFEQHVKMFGANLSEGQPTRGNKAAGLSTIEEKSLGCVAKIGSRSIQQVLEYGEIPMAKGALMMDTPGYDVTSATGMVAAGCQLVVFTTGLGTPVGNALAPVIKVVSNTPSFNKVEDISDINAGTILDGKETITQVGERIFQMMLAVANGQQPKAELWGENQFCIWQTTAVL